MKLLPMITVIIFLSGCSSVGMNSSFSCGVGEGLGCKSVSEVSDIVDSSNITDSRIIQGSQEEQEKAVYSMIQYYDESASSAMPDREPEKRIKVWFAPRIDAYDNFVEETVVYSVIKEARWVY